MAFGFAHYLYKHFTGVLISDLKHLRPENNITRTEYSTEPLFSDIDNYTKETPVTYM